MNIREKAIHQIVERVRDMDFDVQRETMRNTLKRLSDPNLFALYIEIFGRTIERTVGDGK